MAFDTYKANLSDEEKYIDRLANALNFTGDAILNLKQARTICSHTNFDTDIDLLIGKLLDIRRTLEAELGIL